MVRINIIHVVIVLTVIWFTVNTFYRSPVKEQYENRNPWSSELKAKFRDYQLNFDPNIRFDMQSVQQQVTPSEATMYLETGSWKWNSEVEDIYRENISQNRILSVDVEASLLSAKQIYNETAIKELLSWNSKEGSFILGGATIGHSKQMPKNVNNQVRCSPDGKMKQIIYKGYDGINGARVAQVTDITDYATVPKIVDGFKFVGEPCNPCVAMNNDYSCPFVLNTGNGFSMSAIWKILWGLPPEQYNPTFNIDESPLPRQTYTTNYAI